MMTIPGGLSRAETSSLEPLGVRIDIRYYAIALLGLLPAAAFSGFSLERAVVGGGGGTSAGGGFVLTGTAAQPEADEAATGAGFQFTGGFWQQVLEEEEVPSQHPGGWLLR